MATLAETIAARIHNPTESANELNARIKAGTLWDDPADSLALALVVADNVKRYEVAAPAVMKSGMASQTAPADEAFVTAAIDLVDSVNGQRPELRQEAGLLSDLFTRLKPILMPILEKIIADLISRWLTPVPPTPTQQPEFL